LNDLYYKAKGRNYSEEDIYITDKLKNKRVISEVIAVNVVNETELWNVIRQNHKL
jgi:hypothetical protein